jgi:hypothetical protein
LFTPGLQLVYTGSSQARAVRDSVGREVGDLGQLVAQAHDLDTATGQVN